VLDELRAAEQRVLKRLEELQPAVAEYRELEAVAKRLGLETPTANGQSATTARASRATTRRRRQRTPANTSGSKAATPRARRGGAAPEKRADQLLALVRERPGITVAEAGKQLGVDPTGLYRVVRRLEQDGAVRKNGRALEPAGTAA
jgi:transcriptional regulator with GAF, ATPase, and Fis domain